MSKRRTRIFFYGSPPLTYGSAGFYKFITSRGKVEDPLIKILKKRFIIKTLTWTKRVRYRWSQKHVYVIDALPLIFTIAKKSIDKDVIIALGYPALLEFIMLLFISKLRHIPMIVRETHWYWPRTKKSKLLWHIYYKLLRYVDGIICPGRASYKCWKRYGFDNVYVVHYYALESKMLECAENKVREIRRNYNIPEDNVTILYLGRLIRKKGVDLIIRAFAELIRKRPETKAILVIAGDGAERQKLKELSITLGISDRVYFLGPVSESKKKCVYKLADIFVYVPIVETIPEEWPIAPLEAMSLGIPTIVSTAVGSLLDIASAVMVVRWGDVENLTKVIGRMINDKHLQENLSHKAVTVYREISNELNVYHEFLCAILEILKKSRKR